MIDYSLIKDCAVLPYDIEEGRHYTEPGGIRLGVSEVKSRDRRRGSRENL
jgi:hypothetical protein